jgi:hypothetical protein
MKGVGYENSLFYGKDKPKFANAVPEYHVIRSGDENAGTLNPVTTRKRMVSFTHRLLVSLEPIM